MAKWPTFLVSGQLYHFWPLQPAKIIQHREIGAVIKDIEKKKLH